VSGLPFAKVLVANRGEIACRVIRTLRRLGIASVAVYSDADRDARHVREADVAVRIGPPAPAASYLSIAAVVAAAKSTGASAVHPGYGFLSERADFARACEEAGVAFVGPPADVLEGTGDKLGVKATVAKAGVPVIPGPLGEVGEGEAALRAAARETGFPLLLKAVGGGGGRGLRRVDAGDALLAAAESARREAGGAFGDARLYAEALIEPARHVEVQVLCDAAGTVRVLGERDCSVQRRHQKVLEETPAPGLSASARAALHAAGVAAAKAIGYRNAGTVEFLLDAEGRAHFLEVNRRLQVEHPVTEAVHGLDLVEWQLRVAAGEALPSEPWPARGHAVEARVCAEDPERGFVPSSGRILRLREPTGEGIRVDGGFQGGADVPPHYDSLLMKVVAHGKDRAEALDRLDAALSETAVLGVASNVHWLRRVVAHEAFRRGDLRVDFLDRHAADLAVGDEVSVDALLAAAAADLLHLGEDRGGGRGAARAGRARRETAWATLRGFRVTPGGAS
jgi:acetyl-CoA/propionyl-CoA carboxylase biotin carboxyl carrier protein